MTDNDEGGRRPPARARRPEDFSPEEKLTVIRDAALLEGPSSVASESTVYRVLEAEGQNTHRQPTKPRTSHKREEHVADGPGQLLCWDITYLPSTVRGSFFFLYPFRLHHARGHAVAQHHPLLQQAPCQRRQPLRRVHLPERHRLRHPP